MTSRRQKWVSGIKVVYPSFQCTHRYCKDSDIRLSADGVWCEMHYVGAPRCTACGEDRPALPARETGGPRICRDCWQDTFTEVSLPLSASVLGLDTSTEHSVSFHRPNRPDKSVPEKHIAPVPTFPNKCRLEPRGRIHIFAPGLRVCECGHYTGVNLRKKPGNNILRFAKRGQSKREPRYDDRPTR